MLARANTLHVFCGSMALRSFCDELVDAGIDTPYAFDEEDLVRVDREHDDMKLLAIMDVFEMAARGKELGWKRQWCLFRGPAEVLWHAAFEDDGGSEAVKEASLLIRSKDRPVSFGRCRWAEIGGIAVGFGQVNGHVASRSRSMRKRTEPSLRAVSAHSGYDRIVRRPDRPKTKLERRFR